MKKIIQSSVVAALLAVSAQASAQTVTFNFNYLANNGTTPNLTGTSPIGYFPLSIGTITFTDLADLNLGDGKTGVRTTVSLNSNLNQFSAGSTTTGGSIFISSFEINFAGTQNLTEAAGKSWRQVTGGVQVNSVEMNEGGSVSSSGVGNLWGNKTSAFPGFGQEINYTAGSLVAGATTSIDWLNGEVINNIAYNGFSVEQLLQNPVDNQNASLPDVYAWIRVRSTGQAINTANTGQFWLTPSSNANGGRLDVLAVTAVPEAETYAMMMAGLALIGTIVRRRKSA